MKKRLFDLAGTHAGESFLPFSPVLIFVDLPTGHMDPFFSSQFLLSRSMCLGLQVYYNGTALGIKGFHQYVKLVYQGLVIPGVMKEMKLTKATTKHLILKHFSPVKAKRSRSKKAAVKSEAKTTEEATSTPLSQDKADSDSLIDLSQRSDSGTGTLDLSQEEDSQLDLSQSQDFTQSQDLTLSQSQSQT